MDGQKAGYISGEELAAIQYCGIAGATSDCLDAIIRFIHCGDRINSAKLLSCPSGGTSKAHAFILDINHGDIVGIKSGFGSGYSGRGSHGLVQALKVLLQCGVEIEEYEVDGEFIERLDKSCLTRLELDRLFEQHAIRPDRIYDYIVAHGGGAEGSFNIYMEDSIRERFPATIPLHIIDGRIMDLALGFAHDADKSILGAYRRLEDIIKQRTGIKGKVGLKLFSTVFHSDAPKLSWEEEDPGINVAKAKLFDAVFGAYRNPRSHGECKSDAAEKLREFLLVNELFILEKSAIDVCDSTSGESS